MTDQVFPLAEWEFFEARADAAGTMVPIHEVWTQGNRIYGASVVWPEPVWLHPKDVPGRVTRGDTHVPMHPLEVRAMIRRGQTAIEEDADAELLRRIEALPEPEVRARQATLDEMPGGAKTLGRAAHRAGFTQVATYAKGPRVDQYWRVVEISETVLIRGRHADGRRFAAQWITKTAQRGKKAGTTEWDGDFAWALVDGLWTPTGVRALTTAYFTNGSLTPEEAS